MRFGSTQLTGKDGDVRFVRRFAWLPTRDYVGGTWVWMESYVRREYFLYYANEWCETHRLDLPFSRVVYDCRIAEAK